MLLQIHLMALGFDFHPAHDSVALPLVRSHLPIPQLVALLAGPQAGFRVLD